MRIEAQYQQGRVEFLEPVRLKHDRFRMIIDLPDEEVITSDSIMDPIRSDPPITPTALDRLLQEYPDDPWLQCMKAIEADVLAIPDEQFPDLTPKQQQYLAAFALREDR